MSGESEKLQQAKIALTGWHAFDAAIIARLRQVWVAENGEPERFGKPLITIATDGTHLFVNPRFVRDQSLSVLVFALGHEARHIAGRHCIRCSGRNPTAWNIAADIVVNASMEDNPRFKTPDFAIPPKHGTTPEKEYSELIQNGMVTFLESAARACGWVLEAKGPGGRPLTEHERAELETKLKGWTESAYQAAKRVGHQTAGLKRFVDDLLTPTVPWEHILARFVEATQYNDYSWRRPNRRHVQGGIYMPVMYSESLARIGVACDTSGSIDIATLKRVVSELIGLLGLYTDSIVELPVVWCDTKAYPQLIACADDLKPRGGGGTSFAPAFTWFKEHEPDIKAIVYITDGYCTDFGTPPDADVLWILTHKNPAFQPPFGEVVHVIDA